MAVAELIVSRRALLGAACAVPLYRHPGLDPGSTFTPPTPQQGRWIPDQVRNDELHDERWAKALARVRAAEAGLAALAHTEDDDVYGRALGRLNRALRRLLRTPAPHLAALAVKLDLLIAHEVWDLNFAGPSLRALKRDAHRLAASAAP